MCGIAGFWGQGSEFDLNRMIETLSHRGPDDSGTFVDGDLHLGHSRLAIIDLTPSGHQPMNSEDKKISIIFNGEIYNFHEHRDRLKSKGYIFRGTSDTEVILALYEELGEKCFELLSGMFAIAIWDGRRRQLLLARDRMGKKPLYWGIFDQTLIFGSELKSLLRHRVVKKELSIEALSLYLAHEYIPTPYTPFKGIYKLEPASYLTYKDGEVSIKSFWDKSFLKTEPQNNSFTDSLSTLDQLIDKATRERLIADVPVGLLLSGGLDSSTVAYYAARALSENGNKLRTFSIGFKEASYDESVYAKRVASHFSTEHHSKIFGVDDALALLPQLAEQMDEPFADSSLLPTILLSRFAREHVKVVLGGDGGDELCMGYSTFYAHNLAMYYNLLPGFLQGLMTQTVNLLPTSHEYLSLDFKLKRFVRGATLPALERDQAWMGAFTLQEIKNVLSPELARQVTSMDVLSPQKNYFNEVEGDELRRLSWLYTRTYMMDGVMVKADRASMLSSLELRSPLLATKLVEFAFSLPTRFKLNGRTGKYILKKLMEYKLPSEIIYRSKKGFGAPVGLWLKGGLLPLLKEKLSRERIAKQGIFSPAEVDKLVREHEDGIKDNRKALWTLLQFQLWYDAWHD